MKSAAIGVGGTVAYYGLFYLVTLATPGADWTEHLTRYRVMNFLGEAMLVPLVPGALPGVVVTIILGSLGIFDTSWRSPHDGQWLIPCAISAPLVHAYLASRWLKRRSGEIRAHGA